MAQTSGHLGQDRTRTARLAQAGLDRLVEGGAGPDRLAAIGSCFGGTMAFELAP
jgi:dienelactone hydrolase